ncbi:H-NS histone family protein [Mycetohabitans rhizoxinica]
MNRVPSRSFIAQQEAALVQVLDLVATYELSEKIFGQAKRDGPRPHSGTPPQYRDPPIGATWRGRGPPRGGPCAYGAFGQWGMTSLDRKRVLQCRRANPRPHAPDHVASNLGTARQPGHHAASPCHSQSFRPGNR